MMRDKRTVELEPMGDWHIKPVYRSWKSISYGGIVAAFGTTKTGDVFKITYKPIAAGLPLQHTHLSVTD